MQFFDTLPQFFDDTGRPLAGGRLVVYKYLTTDLADIFADSDYVTPANNPFALDNAGTMPFNLFMQESVTVHAQKFIGYDENNVEMYADQKVFNIIVDSDSGTGTTVGYLNSIADLRSYAVEHGKSVTVTGYFTSGDCPSRGFQYDENSSALDNNGSIIESSLTASGRWIWVPRSEEHTSELQSHHDLVCRRLLEKKKRVEGVVGMFGSGGVVKWGCVYGSWN